jgi:hypothetical protein
MSEFGLVYGFYVLQFPDDGKIILAQTRIIIITILTR